MDSQANPEPQALESTHGELSAAMRELLRESNPATPNPSPLGTEAEKARHRFHHISWDLRTLADPKEPEPETDYPHLT